MHVTLLHATPVWIASSAIRTCWRSERQADTLPTDRFMGPNDEKLTQRIIAHGHESTLEHVSFNFEIKGISRAILQELARHRISSFSVESTRYTLKRLMADRESVNVCLRTTGDPELDELILKHMVELMELAERRPDLKNDRLKYGIPEAYITELKWTVNARSLRNFLRLRTSKAAHFEIRELAQCVYNAIPEEYLPLFEDLNLEV